MIKDTKEGTPSRSSQEGLQEHEEGDWYPPMGEGEITSLGALESVLDGIQLETLGEVRSEDLESRLPSRADRVREMRRLKEQARWLKRKEAKRRRGGRPKVYKTHWQRRLRKKDINYYNYHVWMTSKGPFYKYKQVWRMNRIKDIRITEDEFNSLIESVGGLLKVKFVQIYRPEGGEKVVSLDTLQLAGYDGELLYRGTGVPESFKVKR
jgi:hypothetical protein